MGTAARKTWRTAARRLGVALLAATLVGAPACSQEGAPGDQVILAQWAMAVASAQRGDAETVLQSLRPAMRQEVFYALSEARQYEVAQLYAQAARVLGDWPEAHRAYVIATGARQATADDWAGRLHTAILTANPADSYLSLKRVSGPRASVLSSFDAQMLRRLSQLLRDLPDRGAHLAVGQQIEIEGWAPPYAHQDVSDVWLYYAQALLEQGQAEQAIRASRNITNPLVIVAMQADRRFDPVVAAAPHLQDAHKAAERMLLRAQDYADTNPRMLAGKLAVARALILLNRRGEALALLEDAAKSLAVPNVRTPPFIDPELRGVLSPWLSALLMDAGRAEEALDVRLMNADNSGDPLSAADVARTLLHAGNAKHAAIWINRTPEQGLGPGERLSVMMFRACIASATKDETELTRALDVMRLHDAWLPQARTEALVCSNRLDEAEQALVRQLADPRTRLAALSHVQTTAAPTAPTAYVRTLVERRRTLFQRPAVKAAIEKVGRQKTFDLVAWEAVS